jgi:hypothetical protein
MHEIIHVIDSDLLAGTLHRDLEIEAVNDHPLRAGYYFVLWPSQTRMSRDRRKHYYGPLPTLTQARMLQRSALILGLVQDEKVIQKVTKCRSIVCRPASSSNSVIPHNYSQWSHEPCIA